MAIESQGFTLEIENSTVAAVTITDITLGAKTKITGTHDLAVGDTVTFAAVGGTTELNGLTFTVTGIETTTDFWIDVDSLAYGAWTAGGTATPASYTEVKEITGWNGPDGVASTIDTTHLQSTWKEFLMGLPDRGNVSFDMNFVATDPGQLACQAAQAARTLKGFRLTYSDDKTLTFDGVVLSFQTSGGVDGKVDASMSLKISGAATLA